MPSLLSLPFPLLLLVAHRASGLRCCSRSCLQGRGRGCPERRRRRGGRPASWRQISSEDKHTHTGWQIIKASFKFFPNRIVRGTSFTASTEAVETAQSPYTWGKQSKSLGFYEFPSGFMHIHYMLKPLIFCCNKDCIKNLDWILLLFMNRNTEIYSLTSKEYNFE